MSDHAAAPENPIEGERSPDSPFVGRWKEVGGESTHACTGQEPKTVAASGDLFEIKESPGGFLVTGGDGQCTFRVVASEHGLRSAQNQTCETEVKGIPEPGRMSIKSWELETTGEGTGRVSAALSAKLGTSLNCESSQLLEVRREPR